MPLEIQEEHSPIGASSMDRWAVCAGSVRLSKGLPNSSSKYADAGTKAHKFASFWLLHGIEPKFPDTDEGREMRRAVKEYLLHCKAFTTEVALDMGAVWGVEHKFDLSSVFPGCFGTADFWVYWPWLKKLIVIDFKYGAGVFVSVVDNLQLQYYALGCVVTLGFDVQDIELGISQPRCMTDGETFRTWTVPKLTLLFDFRPLLQEKAHATQDPNAPLVTGDHCRWCPANKHRVCPEIEAQKDAHVALVFQPLHAYDPLKLKRALDSRETIKAWLKSLDEFAYRELEQGVEIPGYKLVAKRPRRDWIDPVQVANMLRAAGYGDTMYEVQELKSPAQMEKMLKASKGLIAACVKTESSGHTLVPMDDDRPPLRLSAQQVFTPIVINPLE